MVGGETPWWRGDRNSHDLLHLVLLFKTCIPHMGNNDANMVIKILEKRIMQCFAIKFQVTLKKNE